MEQKEVEPHAEMTRKWYARVTRDTLIFIAGLGGIVNETFFHHGSERPTLILLFAAMIGLPAFLHLDEKAKDGGKK